MKAVIQRVTSASVTIDGEIKGSISQGYMVLLGVMQGDDEHDAEIMAEKLTKLRVFCDENDKMNRSVTDINGEILVISQFTLGADCKKGNRPSFTRCAPPDEAERLYELFVAKLREMGVRKVETGEFGADMAVSLINDGPVTIIYDTAEWIKK